MEKSSLPRRIGGENVVLVVQSKRRKTSLKCPPMCASDTRSYSKATCEQLLRNRIITLEMAPLLKTPMMIMMMMEKTLNHHRNRCPSTRLSARWFQIRSHFDGQRRNSAEHLNLV